MENQTCENCKYFVPHYIKIGSKYINRVEGCGHCRCARFKFKAFYKREKYDLPCDYWEEKESVEEERKNIEEIIRNMARDLNNILLILKDE